MTVPAQATNERSDRAAVVLIGVGLIATVTWTAALSLGTYIAVTKLFGLVV